MSLFNLFIIYIANMVLGKIIDDVIVTTKCLNIYTYNVTCWTMYIIYIKY